jgi:DNA-binding NarL/FixJ family response regulator
MLRVLIISDRAEFRQLLAHHVGLEWRESMTAEYAPALRGALPRGFTGAAYDVVLLDDEVQQGRGLEWLEDLVDRTGCPPVVYFAAAGAAALERAQRAGAACVLPRTEFEHTAFATALRAAERESRGLASGTARAARAAPAPERFGSVRIRGYRCVQRLAVGGSSTVFLAERQRDGSLVALKVFRQVPDLVGASLTFERFLREYELVSRLRHANVVRIHDIGMADDHLFLAMEYLPGGDLRARLRQPLEPREALRLLRQMADALGALHAVGVLHRDVKPGNVLLREDGSLAFIDFGLACRLGIEEDGATRGVICGTPHYMSPEQGRGAPLDSRSDLYSLGVVLYEMLTGTKPYSGDQPFAIVRQHAEAPTPQLAPALAPLQPLLDMLLAKDPGQRPATTARLIAVIDELLASEAA